MRLSPIHAVARTNRPSSAIAFALFLAAILVLPALGCRGTGGGSGDPAPALRIGTSGDYRPFSSGDPASGADPAGFSVDLGRLYARATGRSIEWVPFRWSELAADLEGGRFDLALSGVTVRADRSIAGRFSVPVTVSGAIVLVPASSPLVDRNALDLEGIRFAVNAGGHLERTARALFPEATVVPVHDNAAVLARLDTPAIDAVVTDILEAPHWMARRTGLRAIGPLTRDRKAAWFPIDREAERRRFDRWLLDAERSGALGELRRRHGLPDERTATPVAALLASLDERLSLMVDVARVKHSLGRPVEDLERERGVLASALDTIRVEADRLGVPPPDDAGATGLYREQIEAAKDIQRVWIAARPARARAPSAAARDEALARLNDALRPALIDLGQRIARLLVLSVEARAPAPTRDAVADAVARHELDAARVDRIHAALVQVLGSTRAPD